MSDNEIQGTAAPIIEEESLLVQHVRRELAIINEEQDTVDAFVKLAEIWDGMGHSGGSSSIAIPMLSELLQHNNLSPLTNDPDEWFYHGPDVWGDSEGVWQNKRNGEAFSHDGGKTYYLLSEGGNNKNRHPMHVARDRPQPTV